METEENKALDDIARWSRIGITAFTVLAPVANTVAAIRRDSRSRAMEDVKTIELKQPPVTIKVIRRAPLPDDDTTSISQDSIDETSARPGWLPRAFNQFGSSQATVDNANQQPGWLARTINQFGSSQPVAEERPGWLVNKLGWLSDQAAAQADQLNRKAQWRQRQQQMELAAAEADRDSGIWSLAGFIVGLGLA